MKTFRVRTDGWWVLRDILSTLEPFTTPTGSLYGERSQYVTSNYGRLEEPYYGWLKQAVDQRQLEYVIYSYATPIAWRSNGVWTVPDVSYSLTTTKQQNKVRVAVAEIEAIAA